MTGKAGEYAVAAQLLLRNVLVYWPSVDMGCDLETENSCRIQVKCAHLSNGDDRESPNYQFMFRKQEPVPISNTVAKLVPRKLLVDVCDLIVFWGIEQNRFWIVPAALCDACTGIRLGGTLSTTPRLVANIADVREMVSLGYTQPQIAKHYGVKRSTVQRFLNEGKDCDESIVSQARACENAWEKITNFVRTPATIHAEVQED
jgi:hypothetical protein